MLPRELISYLIQPVEGTGDWAEEREGDQDISAPLTQASLAALGLLCGPSSHLTVLASTS